MKPGIYQGIPSATYHADPCDAPSLSNSLAKIILMQSPAHAWQAHPKLNPAAEKEEKTAFDLGSAAHALLLEGDDRMTVINADSYRTKLAQELRDAAREAGKFPILEKDYDAVYEMANVAHDAIRRCDDLGGLTLKHGNAEQTIIWTDGGIYCRARPDWLSEDRKVMLDYKSTATSANPEEWQRTMLNGWGDLQPAFYLEGNTATGGAEDAVFIWLVQEVTAPFACSFIGVAPELLELGRAKAAKAKAIWRECIQSGNWPGYPSRIHWLTPPAWALSKWEERSGAELPETGLQPGYGTPPNLEGGFPL